MDASTSHLTKTSDLNSHALGVRHKRFTLISRSHASNHLTHAKCKLKPFSSHKMRPRNQVRLQPFRGLGMGLPRHPCGDGSTHVSLSATAQWLKAMRKSNACRTQRGKKQTKVLTEILLVRPLISPSFKLICSQNDHVLCQ